MAKRPRIVAALHAIACIAGLASLSAHAPAFAQSDRGQKAFTMVTGPMDPARRVQFCAFVADHAFTQAAEAPSPEVRERRSADAARLQRRLAPLLARANAALSPADLQRIESENNAYMGVLSYAPSTALASQLSDPDGDNDFLGAWLADLGARCDTMLNAMGIEPTPVAQSADGAADR